MSGSKSVGLFAPLSAMIAVEPNVELCRRWDALSRNGTARKIGQLPVCFDRDRDAAVRRAHEQFRWFGGGWKVNAELPGTINSCPPCAKRAVLVS